ncbi:MAG TPA: hypothetical protein VFF98_05820 [Novosphingobium sp.]|nr:hypothetical protein [Novosphingobium sp.]
MKAFTDLNLGFTNAENYRRRANKELLAKYFVRDEYLEKLLDPNVYFLVGEKGTGKTAYSTYLRNNRYKEKHAFAYDVRQTEYQKFLELKRLGHLPLSQYSEVWRTLLLILSATSVLEKSSTPDFLKKFTKLGALKRAIDDFYDNAFAPEIVKILNFVESSERSTSLMAKYGGLHGGTDSKNKVEIKDSSSTFQTNLLTIRQSFEDAIEALRLDTDHIIFIDGIDVRPAEIGYDDYFECVRGLVDAVWSLNNDFLADIKDSRGRIRVVLLVRPDIFLRTGLHNVNTKIRDNSVFLNWSTTYKDYRTSSLFRVADRLLSAQQDEVLESGKAWDHYFPFHAENVRDFQFSSSSVLTSFLAFLRFSYYRPRDINAMLGTMKDILLRRGATPYVSADDFSDPTFRDAHADYLLGEIRDQLLFYYSQEEFDLFLLFFQYLKGKKKFTYDEFTNAVTEFVAECVSSGKVVPKFFESVDVFLQFLYEQNVICYIETDDERSDSERFIRWCFRERTPSNLSPKVRSHVEYEIFYGLTKALNVGRSIKTKKPNSKREFGTVVGISPDEKFGFIRGGIAQIDHYFQFSQLKAGYSPRVGDRVSYSPAVKYGKLRAHAIQRA